MRCAGPAAVHPFAAVCSPSRHLAVILLCAGCGVSDRSEAPGPGRTDSAGVAIVRNTDAPAARGELVQPARRVFGSEEEGPELFGGVGGARLHRNGSLWIAESQTQEIRVFDPGSGEHLFTVGGRGDGPGEFRRSGFLGFDGEGNAYVYDETHRRLSVFSESGEFQRSHLMPSSLGIMPGPLAVTRTGNILGQIPQLMERKPANGSTVRDTVRIWTMPLDGSAPALMWETLGALWYFRDDEQVVVPYTGGLPAPYAGGSIWGLRADRVYVTDAAGEASYSVYGPGGLERRVEIDRAPSQVDGFSAAAFVERLRGRVTGDQLRIYEGHLSDMPIPEARRRPWDAVLPTDEGGVWLLRAGGAEAAMAGVPEVDLVWDAFDAEGVFVGPVRLPANVWPAQVRGRTVLTTVHDEMGRVAVSIHDIRWVR